MQNNSKSINNSSGIHNILMSIFDNFIYGMFFVIILSIVTINLFANINYYMQRVFCFNNKILLLFGLFFCLVFLILSLRLHCNKVNINILTIILFLSIAYLSFNISYEVNWDNYTLIRNAKLIAGGAEDFSLDRAYFSKFPNNYFILMIFTVIFKLHNIAGIFTQNDHYMPIILIQCLIMSLSARLLYNIVIDIVKKPLIALMAFLVYSVFVVFSGWSVVTYTDQFSLIVPLLVLRCYQLLQNKKHPYLMIYLIICISFFGMHIKPTVIIATIAIVLYELFHCKIKLNIQLLKIVLSSVLLIATLYTSYHFLANEFSKYSKLYINKDLSFTYKHYIMMGLNEETEGTFSEQDVANTIKFTASKSQDFEQSKIIKNRIKNLISTGKIWSHIVKKSLNNFNDGSFFWNNYVGFVKNHFPDLNYHLAPLLKNWYFGNHSIYHITIHQTIWLVLLFTSLFIVFIKKSKEISVMIISLIGFIIFVMLFEASPRQAINFASYFVILYFILLDRLSTKLKKVLKIK